MVMPVGIVTSATIMAVMVTSATVTTRVTVTEVYQQQWQQLL